MRRKDCVGCDFEICRQWTTVVTKLHSCAKVYALPIIVHRTGESKDARSGCIRDRVVSSFWFLGRVVNILVRSTSLVAVEGARAGGVLYKFY